MINGNDLFLEILKHYINIERETAIRQLSLCKTVLECGELKSHYLGKDSFVETAIQSLDGKEDSFRKLLIKMGVTLNGKAQRED